MGDLRLEIDIDAPTAKVWQALTLDLGVWWPAEFYTGGADGGRTTVLEPTPGGLMKESWDDGGGLVWAGEDHVREHEQSRAFQPRPDETLSRLVMRVASRDESIDRPGVDDDSPVTHSARGGLR